MKEAPGAVVLELTRSKDDGIRARATALLGADHRARSIELATDPAAAVRAEAFWNLARTGPDAGLFARAEKDESPDVRAAAWLGLWILDAPDRPAVGALTKLVADPDCARAVEVIGRLGPAAVGLLPELVEATKSDDDACVLAATRALDGALRMTSSGTPRYRRYRFREQPKKVREACEKAWRWLATTQRPLDGAQGRGWSCAQHGGHAGCDVGVTALAVLAFTAAGLHAESDRYGPVLRDAGRCLRGWQENDGRIFGAPDIQYMIQHAIATDALCELILLGPARESEVAVARRALAYIRRARNPEYGWGYSPRGGDNDTFTTTWMLSALRTGEHAGLGRDMRAYVGALSWYQRMSDPEFGVVGYQIPGGPPSRMVKPGVPRSTRKVVMRFLGPLGV